MKGHGVSREPGILEFTFRSVSGNEVKWHPVGPSTDL